MGIEKLVKSLEAVENTKPVEMIYKLMINNDAQIYSVGKHSVFYFHDTLVPENSRFYVMGGGTLFAWNFEKGITEEITLRIPKKWKERLITYEDIEWS